MAAKLRRISRALHLSRFQPKRLLFKPYLSSGYVQALHLSRIGVESLSRRRCISLTQAWHHSGYTVFLLYLSFSYAIPL
jgi:hypothetical protein